MKKVLALTLVVMLLLSSATFAIATAVSGNNGDVIATSENQYKLYLVPGTYVSGGSKVANTIASGATKLSQDECDAIFTDNAYICTLSADAELPTPTSERVDKEGNPYTFNGWWTIVDAMVTYFDKVPTLTADTFLYADWRADLSQPMDPVEPSEDTTEVLHYMQIKRAATGETEQLVLRAGPTDLSHAEQLGYGYAVQLYAIRFELCPGDEIAIYTVGLTSNEEPQIAPIARSSSDNRGISLDTSSENGNATSDYLTADVPDYWRAPCTIKCTADVARYYDIYIKFFAGGTTMTIYMEPTRS